MPWIERYSAALEKQQSRLEQKMKVTSVWNFVSKIREETVQNQHELKILIDAIKELDDLLSFEIEYGYKNQFGIHIIDQKRGIAELYYYGVMDSPDMFERKMILGLNLYIEKILPHAKMDRITAVATKDDYEFLDATLRSGWNSATNIDVLHTYNEDKKNHVHLESPTVEELVEVGLHTKNAKKCVNAMKVTNPEPNEYQNISHTIWKVKDDVISDPNKIEEIEKVLREYADATQFTKGKRACSTSYSKEKDSIHIIEYHDSDTSFDAHVGYVLPIVENLMEYTEFDQYTILCSKDARQHFITIAEQLKPRKLIIMERIENTGRGYDGHKLRECNARMA